MDVGMSSIQACKAHKQERTLVSKVHKQGGTRHAHLPKYPYIPLSLPPYISSERCKERCEGDEWEVWGRFFTSLAHLSLISFTSLHCIQKYSVSSSAIIAIWLHWKLHNANRTPINQLVSSMIIKQHTSNRIRTSLHASVRLYIHAWHPVHWTSRVSMIHSVRISVHTLGALADSCSQLCGVSAFLATENSPLSALSMTHCLADCSFKK